MSDLKDQMQLEIERQAKIEALNRESKAKQAYITNKKTTFQMDRLVKSEKELKIAQETNFGALSDEEVDKLRRNNLEYMQAASTRMWFINPAFNEIVPYFQKNLILIGGKTGEGKSTTVANIVFSTLSQKNPATQRPARCLVITNEEKSEDVYNRITCHMRGWQYTNHDKFTKEQIEEFDKMIGILSHGGKLTVIDNNYNGAFGLTTSLEGICSIFDNLIAQKEWYDVILIDYYQKVKFSKVQPELDEYKVQAMLSEALDTYKNVYPAPIVVLAQVNPNKADEEVPFEFRIKGRKVICDAATFIMEMVANKKELKTDWLIHKSRFTVGVGEVLVTGFDRGRYVEMTDEYRASREEILAKRIAAENAKTLASAQPKLNKGKSDDN